MELRTRILAIIGSVFFVLLLIGVMVVVWSRTRETATNNPPAAVTLPPIPPPPTQPNNNPPVVQPPIAQPPQPTSEDILKGDLSSIAFSFTERYGSFSNQGNYDNIDTLRFLMTRSMNQWADQYIAKLKASPPPALYYGISTKTLSTSVESFDINGSITILVTTQRKETRGATANSALLLQTLRLTFLNEDGVWKVDQAQWGARETVER